MFFIFCYTRKETTLLAQCLHAHDEVVIPDGTDFYAPAAFVFNHVKDPQAGREVLARLVAGTDRFPHSLGRYLTADEVLDAVRSAEYSPPALFEAIYRKLAQKTKKKFPGDALIGDMAYIGILNATGFFSPDQKIIHFIRVVRDLVVSLRRLGRLDKYSEVTYPASWSNANLPLYSMLSGQPARYLMARYEDFVLKPEEQLRRICAFLDVDYSPKMLDPGIWEPRFTGDPGQMRTEKISPESIGEYKTKLTPEQVRYCEREAKEAMKVFGYETSSSSFMD